MKGYFMAKNNFVVELIFKECHLLKKKKNNRNASFKVQRNLWINHFTQGSEKQQYLS